MYTALKTSQVPAALELWNQGDSRARDQLIAYAVDRLRKLAAALLQRNSVRRWEQSDDLLQQAAMRLHRSLERATPRDAKALLQLAALEMRHALIDLARHYYGPRGIGCHYHSAHGRDSGDAPFSSEQAEMLAGPLDAADRAESIRRLYLAIDGLPGEEREVVDLVWMHELSQAEAAAVLGVAMKTVARRWRRARLRLYEALQHSPSQS